MLYVKSPKTQKRDKALNVFVPLPWKRAHGPPFFCVFFDLVWHKLQEKPWFVELLWAKKKSFVNVASLLKEIYTYSNMLAHKQLQTYTSVLMHSQNDIPKLIQQCNLFFHKWM